MSELINARNGRRDFRWHFLTTVSALALLAPSTCERSHGRGSKIPIVLRSGSSLAVAGTCGRSRRTFSPLPCGKRQFSHPAAGNAAAGAESVRIRLWGRRQDTVPARKFGLGFLCRCAHWPVKQFQHVQHQTNKASSNLNIHSARYYHFLIRKNFADTQSSQRESHTILDFSAGKDVGLGMFGKNSSSTLNFGVSFAQFSAKETFDVRARPDLHFKYSRPPGRGSRPALSYLSRYGQASRSFHGVGPSLSWNGSAPFIGNPQEGELTFDWGMNAASCLAGKRRKRSIRKARII